MPSPRSFPLEAAGEGSQRGSEAEGEGDAYHWAFAILALVSLGRSTWKDRKDGKDRREGVLLVLLAFKPRLS
ncbi:hypothetical protein ACLKA6_015975 [Drosophila palustris]